MAESVLDRLECARRLRDAGVPEKQAEALAELLAEALLFDRGTANCRKGCRNVDFAASRPPGNFSMDARFAEQETRFRQYFTALGKQLSLHNWLLAAVASTIILPALRDLLTR